MYPRSMPQTNPPAELAQHTAHSPRRAGLRDIPALCRLAQSQQRRAERRHRGGLLHPDLAALSALSRRALVSLEMLARVALAELYTDAEPTAMLAMAQLRPRSRSRLWRAVGRFALAVAFVGAGLLALQALWPALTRSLGSLGELPDVSGVVMAVLGVLSAAMVLALLRLRAVSSGTDGPLRRARRQLLNTLNEPVWEATAYAGRPRGAEQLSAQLLARADHAGAAVVARTSGEARARLYGRYRFEIVTEVRPWGRPPAYLLCRRPASR